MRAGDPAVVLAPAKDERLHVAEATSRCPEAEHEVVVLGPARVAVAAGRLERVAAHRERGMRERALDEDVARRRLSCNEPVQPALVPAGAVANGLRREVLDAAAARDEILGVEDVHLRPQAIRERDVVGVEPRDDAPAGRRAGALERRDDAPGALADDAEAGIRPGVLRGDRPGPIPG
ncbi:MAG TPA: hypothetical protein VK915_08950, partial [Gaiellaceae bacterium]|nr:hypothetical protein [Gaiellaceae bacterium]